MSCADGRWNPNILLPGARTPLYVTRTHCQDFEMTNLSINRPVSTELPSRQGVWSTFFFERGCSVFDLLFGIRLSESRAGLSIVPNPGTHAHTICVCVTKAGTTNNPVCRTTFEQRFPEIVGQAGLPTRPFGCTHRPFRPDSLPLRLYPRLITIEPSMSWPSRSPREVDDWRSLHLLLGKVPSLWHLGRTRRHSQSWTLTISWRFARCWPT